ncbi:hypothetical protein Bpfe_002519 [Biomphalaria pfeifferi]|uniref:Uncharacterized protein n=1 Tax=Biomphalaria pfeifferi TaxID=112525 RepID=A0AAD8FMI2_BIOPF|nr:hypothetical protein Bpfe_002519 [Biomphalaria pfeifferi]
MTCSRLGDTTVQKNWYVFEISLKFPSPEVNKFHLILLDGSAGYPKTSAMSGNPILRVTSIHEIFKGSL